MSVTPRQRIALEFLAQKHADTWAIGVRVYCRCPHVEASANPERIGAGVCAALRKQGLIVWDRKAWRLTAAGREIVE